tara:strand:+ start:121 stop:867 length:747 start_codon:yes stop_codon:yes gene_type:complete
MKYKYLIIFKIIKFFKKKYQRFFNSLFKQKLNSVLLDLQENHIEINDIYDVGAYKGNWSYFLDRTSLKNKNFYLFESNFENEKYLKKYKYKYFIETLSDDIKEVKFFSKSHVGDSYYRENTDFYPNDIKPLIKKTTTLNIVQKTNNLPMPDFLKIDTQGSEIDILKGANQILKKCKIILLECPIINYNKGAPSIDQYINYLNSIEFLPFDACELHYIDNVLVQIDIIFLKKNIFAKITNKKPILKIFN